MLLEGTAGMYRVLIVDDEILIREKVAQRIAWQELGFELVAACENGQQAIEILEDESIDVVLTDICMPYVDGIELAKYVYEKGQGIQVVILSGYAEFEYAKQAVKYQVCSYLLKPITSAELIQVMKEIRQKLDSVRKNRKMQNLYQGSYSLFRNQNLMRVARGDADEQQTKEILREYGAGFCEGGGSLLCGNFMPQHPSSRSSEGEVREKNRGIFVKAFIV